MPETVPWLLYCATGGVLTVTSKTTRTVLPTGSVAATSTSTGGAPWAWSGTDSELAACRASRRRSRATVAAASMSISPAARSRELTVNALPVDVVGPGATVEGPRRNPATIPCDW